MHKTKTFDENKKNKVRLARKKTFDYKNIDLDKDISEMDTNINKIPVITTKKFIFDKSNRIREFNLDEFIHKENNSRKNKFNIKVSPFKHCNSITTNSSYGEKAVKKVTFSTVEIIRVKNYKKYNASLNFSKNLIKKNMEEMKENENESGCSIF